MRNYSFLPLKETTDELLYITDENPKNKSTLGFTCCSFLNKWVTSLSWLQTFCCLVFTDRAVIVWSWGHATIMHTEKALRQLWSSFDSSNCPHSWVNMGLSLTLSYSKKHLVGMLMNKNDRKKKKLPSRQAFDMLAVRHFDYLNSLLKTYKKKLSSDNPFGTHRRCNCCAFVQ